MTIRHKNTHKCTHTLGKKRTRAHMRSLSGPSAISHPAQAGKPIFEVHIDFLNQRVTKWRRSINLHVWQHRGARSECISWCAGWMECAALTHSASQWDRRLAPCQSGREREREMDTHHQQWEDMTILIPDCSRLGVIRHHGRTRTEQVRWVCVETPAEVQHQDLPDGL